MDLLLTTEELEFQRDVRAFVQERLPRAIAAKVRNTLSLSKADMEQWHAILNERGWLAYNWPTEWGGTGWTPIQQYLFDLETAMGHAPKILPFGISMLGPTLIKYGSQAQKEHWLPRILDGSDWWCQGFSEPGAGSDLASLTTSALRHGDHYIVNGQKTWTTLGQHADMIFCLVRTASEGKKQQGISFLLIDMKSPGIEVRPIILLDGEHEVNEIFFTDVRVPAQNLVGKENEGWTYAKYLLSYERTNIAGVGHSMAALDRLKEIARHECKDGRPLIQDPLFAARLARIEIDLENMKTSNLRVITAAGGGGAPLAQSAMLKVKGTEIRQEITALTRRAVGGYARLYGVDALAERWAGGAIGPEYVGTVSADYFNNRKLSIFGGSNEVQREIIAKSVWEG